MKLEKQNEALQKKIEKREDKINSLEAQIAVLKATRNERIEKKDVRIKSLMQEIKDLKAHKKEEIKALKEINKSLVDEINEQNAYMISKTAPKIESSVVVDLEDAKYMIQSNNTSKFIKENGAVRKGDIIKITKLNKMAKDMKTRKMEIFKFFKDSPFSKFDFENSISIDIPTSSYNKIVEAIKNDEDLIKRFKSLAALKDTDAMDAIEKHSSIVLNNKNGNIFISVR